MSSTSVRKALQEYFASMNSITQKLMEDVKLFSKDHDKGLLGPSYNDNSDSHWKKLIDPSILQHYESVAGVDVTTRCFPVLLVESGEKLVIDEDTSNGRPFGSSWKDEHSAPFSWGTKSQLNLHLLVDENGCVADGQPRTPKTPPSARSCKKLPTPKATPRPSPRPSPALNRKGIKPPDEEIGITKEKNNEKLNLSSTLPRYKPALDLQESMMSQTLKSAVKSQSVVKAHTLKPIVKAQTLKPVTVSQTLRPAVSSQTLRPAVSSQTLKPTDPKPSLEIIIVKQADSEIAIIPAMIPDEIVADPEPEKEKEASETSIEMDLDSPTKSIPKTGFDFLDNW